MATTLKPVKVKRTVYSGERNPAPAKQYIDDCVANGSTATLYADPAIAAAFYTEGTNAGIAIKGAKDAYDLAPTGTNHNAILDKIKLGKVWLGKYSDKVEVIANADANRTTREEAATNIGRSYLTPQKLVSTRKGIPATPIVSGETVGSGKIDTQIINGAGYDPSQTTYIVAEVEAGATFTISEGQLVVDVASRGQVVIKTAAKKGKFTHFTGLKAGAQYAICAYAQNGKNQISELSAPIFVKG